MANKADVYIKNALKDSVNLIRKTPDGDPDFDAVIKKKVEKKIHQEKVYLGSPEALLVISAPKDKDTKGCPITVESDVDLSISYSRTDSNWTVHIIPNDLPPDTPTSVNITLGPEGP